MSSADGCAPAVTTSAPSTAIIAPLSVHSAGRGVRSAMPGFGRPLGQQRAQPPVGRHPAADQQMLAPRWPRQASMALAHSTSQTASWKLAATSATGTLRPVALRGLDPAGHRGLQPGEGEVEPMPDQVLGRGQTAREAIAARVARRGTRSICGPPG